MNILGISGQERDAAAALIQDGRVVAAIEEEKLARIRHAGMNYLGGLPDRAIAFCLDRAGLTFDDLDYVAYYLEPHKLFHREVAFNSSRATQAAEQASIEEFPPYFVESLNGLKQRLKTKRMVESRLSSRGHFVQVPHHLAHAASSFYVSGFSRAAIISADNKGDMTSTALITGDGGKMTTNAEAQFPNSIGLVFSAVTAALGFGYDGDWHKTMWLAPTGEPEFEETLSEFLMVDSNGLPLVNQDYFESSFRGTMSLSKRFFDALGFGARQKDEPILPRHRNLAASLQACVERALCEIASRFRERTGEENLCLAGGVALNSLINAAIERRAGFKRVFIQPAAGNAGCSIGAALYVWHQLLNNEQRGYAMEHAFLGPTYDDDTIKSVLDNCKLAYEYSLTEDKLIAEVARVLDQGRIVGWFRGAMEFGPRTLGGRSILASPTSEMMRDNLNSFIKHREEYRPFSAAIPEERAAEFFETSALTAFLQGVSRVKESTQRLIPAAVFGDGLVRVQTVSRKTNPPFWKLLVKFGEASGVPVLLNTSFNLFGEPVVSTPREAVRGFYCSGIDCLAIGNFLIKK
ncbi:MAG TPA: carbamoyltransferase C-terminal domain-containing protein [Blastocatellia bacterium]|nr:carbamoyltransferase C-terminal domain-containing protein [Blastocatellia bacterium]